MCGVGRCMIRMMCGVRLIDRVSTDVLRDRVGVVAKIEDMIIAICGGMVMPCAETSIPKKGSEARQTFENITPHPPFPLPPNLVQKNTASRKFQTTVQLPSFNWGNMIKTIRQFNK